MLVYNIFKRNGVIGTIYKLWDRITHKILPFPITVTRGIVPSYDGTGQCVHPDSILYNDKLIFTYTPYPYGVDTYENPSIGMLSFDGGVIPIKGCQPLIEEKDYKYHLSDPTLFIDGRCLYIIYRRTLKQDSKHNELYYKRTNDFLKWSHPEKILTSLNNDLISPAVIGDERKSLIYVNTCKICNQLEVAGLKLERNSLMVQTSTKTVIEKIGFDDRQIWHIDICSLQNVNVKNFSPYLAIVTLVKDRDYSLAYSIIIEKREHKLLIYKLQDIELTDVGVYNMVYKSTICKNKDEINLFVSVQDRRMRWTIKKFTANGYKEILYLWKKSGEQALEFLQLLDEERYAEKNIKEYICI